jgi:hypothetical protein
MDKGTIVAIFVWMIAALLLLAVYFGEDENDLD